jgi:hypothetical protein
LDRYLTELLGLTVLAVAATCAALLHGSELFTWVFAISAGLGGSEIIRRAVDVEHNS